MQARAAAPAAAQLTRALARHADGALIELWQRSGMPPGAALVAVGGYGRGELFPHSDVDVLVLLPGTGEVDHAANDALRAAVEGFITACWDIGLEIGSSVRTVDECVAEAANDVTVQTAMLESRFVAGARRLYRTFQKRHRRGGRSAGLPARQDAGDAPAPHQVRGHAVRAGAQLQGEPRRPARPAGGDLGGARGGPRDATGTSWHANGLITPFEVRQLQRNEGTLKLIRARLHVIADRREDRLVFDLQTAVAESFGYKPRQGPAHLRGADAPLLLGGQGGDAAQPDPDAQHRGAAHRLGERSRCGRSTSASSTAAACSRWRATTCT